MNQRNENIRKLKRIFLYAALMIIAVAYPICSFSQMPIRLKVRQYVAPDSIDVELSQKKNFWRASAEVVGLNTALWTFDRYIRRGDFARISLHSVKENFKHGFHWDNDNLPTNTFMHPYNGSLFFNAGRSNGFNYWQSELFAIGGSTMWELFMENEYPSTNDIIATPIGGACLGEVMFRASDAVLDDRTTGWTRFGREVAAFFISPMRGLNRIVTGQAWQHRSTSGRVFGTPEFAAQISMGLRALQEDGYMKSSLIEGAFQIDVEYGDRFAIKSRKPFDYFIFKMELNTAKSQPLINQIEIRGRLLAKEYLESWDQHLSIGLYQHFDYYDTDTINQISKVPYKLGIPACLGVGILFRDIQRTHHIFDAYLHANAVILGSVLSDHYQSEERNYNWASGFSIKTGLNFVFLRDLMSLAVTSNFYRLYTWAGYKQGVDPSLHNYKELNVQGDKSSAYFIHTEARVDIRLIQKLYATLSFSNYYRASHYRDFSNRESNSTAIRLMLTYKL